MGNMIDIYSHFFLPLDPNLQICIEGQCVPFYPDGHRIVPPMPDVDTNDIGEEDHENQQDDHRVNNPLNIVDGRPAWYDPIFTQTFIELKSKIYTAINVRKFSVPRALVSISINRVFVNILAFGKKYPPLKKKVHLLHV